MIYRAWYFEGGKPTATTKHSNQFDAVYCAATKTRFRKREFIVVRDGDSEVLASSENAPTDLHAVFEGEPKDWFHNWVGSHFKPENGETEGQRET